MSNRLTDPKIWEKEWFCILTPELKLFYKFLCDNCNIAGIWSPNWSLVKFWLWIEKPVDPAVFGERSAGRPRVRLLKDGKWFLDGFIEFQQKINDITELNEKNNCHLGIIRILRKEGLLFSPCVAPKEPLTRGPGKGKSKGKEGGMGETRAPFHPPPQEFTKLGEKL